MFTKSLSLTILLGSFAVAAPALREVVSTRKAPGYLGVRFQQEPGTGLMITEVNPDTPAMRAGLQPRDLIQKIDGIPMANADTGDLQRLIGGARPGFAVPIEIRRGETTLIIKVIIGPRPADFEPTGGRPIPYPVPFPIEPPE